MNKEAETSEQQLDYIRARTPEQKQERMDAIMAAADALFQAHPYHHITMGTIAEKLGWSRSNLYKYAATQEEIFLSLHAQKNRAWVDALVDALQSAPLLPQEFACTWAAVSAKHAAFFRYQEILISIIESNVTLDRLVEFKKGFAEMLEPIVDLLCRQCGIGENAARDLYLCLLYQAPGLWNHYHCTKLTSKALKIAGIPPADGCFEDAYASFVFMCVENAS